MPEKKPTIDGFIIPRRQRSQPKARLDMMNKTPQPITTLPPIASVTPPVTPAAPRRADVLDGLDLPDEPSKPKKRRRKLRLRKPSRRAVKITFLIILLLVLAGLGYFAYKLFTTSNKVFQGNPLAAILSQGKELKMDADGRSNILLFGTSEDDPGHPGAELTDSIMVASIDQKQKDVFLVSIPRDLNVEYGRACNSGYRGKINEVYTCHKQDDDANEVAAQTAFRGKVGEVLGLDVQYSVHVNYTALKQAVDAVGGITVMIESDDSRGIYERYVKLPNGPAVLNGEAALALARARNAEGGYGLSRSNFDREQYQQKILIALRDKALSAGTLANPVTVTNLIDALGNHVRTNFDTEEVKTLVKLGQDTPSESIKRLDLNSPESMLLNGDAQPVAGQYNYREVQAYIKAYATRDYAAIEKAVIAVLNASGQPGAAQAKAEELNAAGLSVKSSNLGNAPVAAGSTPLQLIDQSGGKKPETLKKLESVLGIKATTAAPAGVGSNADFIVIVGASPVAPAQ